MTPYEINLFSDPNSGYHMANHSMPDVMAAQLNAAWEKSYERRSPPHPDVLDTRVAQLNIAWEKVYPPLDPSLPQPPAPRVEDALSDRLNAAWAIAFPLPGELKK